jgi:CubicO group peptidase (beta-lactamase class C family)
MSVSGLSTQRLGRLHQVMARHVEQADAPGLLTLVSRRGETFVDTIGTTGLDGGRPVARDTLWRVSSMTKPVVAAATMVLVEECTLGLDQPVDRWLPELAEPLVLRTPQSALDDTVPAERAITVRDLLTLTLGTGMLLAPPQEYPIVAALADHGLGPGPPSPATSPPADEWVARLGSLPLIHQPGRVWMYNTGSELLGILIARACGQSLETFLRERLFEPAGMTDTGFWVRPESIDRLATSYFTHERSGSLEVYDEAVGGQWSRPPVFVSGGAGLVSTADDFLAFGRMLLDQGRCRGERVLARPSVQTMTTDQLTAAQKQATGPGLFAADGWGFGVAVVTRRTDPSGSVGRFGWDGGLGTTWYCDPAEDMVAVLMTQSAWTSPEPPALARDFLAGVYAAIDD